MSEIIIRNGTINEVVYLSRKIPEFFQPYSEITYEERLSKGQHLILVAELAGKPAGFKVGYQRFSHDIFYSWMGGVLNEYRRKGIASKLADEQETWAKNQGYTKIIFKTRNRLTNMIYFGLNRGFMIVGLIKEGNVEEYRLVLEKML